MGSYYHLLSALAISIILRAQKVKYNLLFGGKIMETETCYAFALNRNLLEEMNVGFKDKPQNTNNDNGDREKKIFCVIAIVITLIEILYFCITHCSIDGNLGFQRILNQRTGAPSSVLASIIIYLFLWHIFGLLPVGTTVVLLEIISCFVFPRRQPHDRLLFTELEAAVWVAMGTSYIATLLIILLYMFGVISINI